MKKLLLTLALVAVITYAASCSDSTGKTGGDTTGDTTGSETTAPVVTEPATEEPSGSPIDKMPLGDILEKIYEGVENLPEVYEVELNEENFANFVFTEYKEGYEALCSEAMINITTHSVVLLRVPEGADAEAIADEIAEKADPFKWVCVSADKVIVRRAGNTILLVMSYEGMADKIAENFDNLAKA